MDRPRGWSLSLQSGSLSSALLQADLSTFQLTEFDLVSPIRSRGNSRFDGQVEASFAVTPIFDELATLSFEDNDHNLSLSASRHVSGTACLSDDYRFEQARQAFSVHRSHSLPRNAGSDLKFVELCRDNSSGSDDSTDGEVQVRLQRKSRKSQLKRIGGESKRASIALSEMFHKVSEARVLSWVNKDLFASIFNDGVADYGIFNPCFRIRLSLVHQSQLIFCRSVKELSVHIDIPRLVTRVVLDDRIGDTTKTLESEGLKDVSQQEKVFNFLCFIADCCHDMEFLRCVRKKYHDVVMRDNIEVATGLMSFLNSLPHPADDYVAVRVMKACNQALLAPTITLLRTPDEKYVSEDLENEYRFVEGVLRHYAVGFSKPSEAKTKFRSYLSAHYARMCLSRGLIDSSHTALKAYDGMNQEFSALQNSVENILPLLEQSMKIASQRKAFFSGNLKSCLKIRENNFESSQVSYPDEIKFHFFMERREDNVMLETQWALNKLLRVKKQLERKATQALLGAGSGANDEDEDFDADSVIHLDHSDLMASWNTYLRECRKDKKLKRRTSLGSATLTKIKKAIKDDDTPKKNKKLLQSQLVISASVPKSWRIKITHESQNEFIVRHRKSEKGHLLLSDQTECSVFEIEWETCFFLDGGANTVEWMEVHLISLNVQQETNAPLGKVSEREVRQRIIRDLHRRFFSSD